MVSIHERKNSDAVLRKIIDRPWLTKHGDSRTRLYRTWQSMKYRCYNKKHNAYHKYGGVGITVCKDWMNSYPIFKNWALKNGYQDNLTIDRKDGRCGYSPENCRWVTYLTQNTNLPKLKNNTSGFRGVAWHGGAKKWVVNISMKNKTKYIGAYDSKEDAADARDLYIKENNLPHQPSRY